MHKEGYKNAFKLRRISLHAHALLISKLKSNTPPLVLLLNDVDVQCRLTNVSVDDLSKKEQKGEHICAWTYERTSKSGKADKPHIFAAAALPDKTAWVSRIEAQMADGGGAFALTKKSNTGGATPLVTNRNGAKVRCSSLPSNPWQPVLAALHPFGYKPEWRQGTATEVYAYDCSFFCPSQCMTQEQAYCGSSTRAPSARSSGGFQFQSVSISFNQFQSVSISFNQLLTPAFVRALLCQSTP
jgi:hypothetical protein